MLREDVVAPALVLVVILGVWWVGARVIEEFWNPRDTVAAPRTEPPATPRRGRPEPTPRSTRVRRTRQEAIRSRPAVLVAFGGPVSRGGDVRRRARDRRDRVRRLAGRHRDERGDQHD